MDSAAQNRNLNCSNLLCSLPITRASSANANTFQYAPPHRVTYHTISGDTITTHFNTRLQTDGQMNAALYSSNPAPTVAPTSLTDQQHLPPQAPVFQYQWPQMQPEMHFLHQPRALVAPAVVSQMEGHYMNTNTSGPLQTLSPGSLEIEHFKVLDMDPLRAMALFSSGPDDIYSSGKIEYSHAKEATKMIPTSTERPSLYTYFHSAQLPSSYQSNIFDGPTPVYEPLPHEFVYRSPEFGSLSSPEVVSPASEHSLFGVSDEESYFSFVPGTMQTTHALSFDHMNFATGSLDPAPSMSPISPLARLDHSSSSVQYFPESSLPLSSSQPLSVGTQVGSLSDSDPAMDSSNEIAESTSRRRNRALKSRPRNKILVKYTCSQADCDVVCSSLPSLARHMHSHKWKGKYPPIRCGSCNRELSNEYSAQRHIMRSSETSSCKRLRSYNIMRSTTCIDYTVRFYPRRPHGKKTVRIDLPYARRKYLGLL